MSIVAGLFRSVFPTLMDNLSAQGVIRPREGGGGLIPQMMIGEGGLRNLEKAGVDLPMKADDLAMAQFDLESIGRRGIEEKTDWLQRGVEIDPNAEKVMYEIPDDEVRMLKGRDPNKLEGEYGFTELFKADLLTNAYPEIEDLVVKVVNEPKSSRAGGFDPVKNVLVINRGHDYVKENGLKRTVLHEVQHFVQEKENFTRGESFATRLNEEEDYVLGSTAMAKALQSDVTASDLARMLTNEKGLNFSAAKVQEAMQAIAANPGVDTKKIVETILGTKEMADKFISRANQYPALRGFLESKEMADEGYIKAFDKYQRVTGEQFANATMNRADMNAAQRMERPVRQDLLDPNTMLPSSFQAQMAQQNVVDPNVSSIQSSIPQGL